MAEFRAFGIRHHGPGSARSLLQALDAFQPDAVLIEGPPEADALLARFGDEALQPPVAILVYDPENPQRAAFYPFAEYSPEWQAARWALERGIPVRFCDAPVAALEPFADPEGDTPPEDAAPPPERAADPLQQLAQAAGFADTEGFWDVLVEQRRDSHQLFSAVEELMQAARGPDDAHTLPRDLRREAHMRLQIRAELKAGRQRLAMVCGAWHAPVLDPTTRTLKADQELTRGVSRRKLMCTLVPWSEDRLQRASGYGAGVESPAWFRNLWQHGRQAVERFVVHAARCSRQVGLDIGPAHAIEAGRLAHALAALRHRPEPGLEELLEALRTVYGEGDGRALQLIHQQLVVGEALGQVPEGLPSVPLLADLEQSCRRLRLKMEAGERLLDIDLREDGGRARSALLHRLRLLGVPWGRNEATPTGARGSFHEHWRLRWDPAFVVQLIDRARYGGSLAQAAARCLEDAAAQATQLSALGGLLQECLRADLPDALPSLLSRFDATAAATSDVHTLMGALPPMVELSRYGDVRGTDLGAAEKVRAHLLERIVIGLPLACVGIDTQAAQALRVGLDACDSALARAGMPAEDWNAALLQVADGTQCHPLLGGRATRLLLDRSLIDSAETARRLRLALSPAVAADQASWVEGLLGGSGLLLIHQPELLAVIDAWLRGLSPPSFIDNLPLLRRAFADFSLAERRQIGAAVSRGPAQASSSSTPLELDPQRMAAVLPILQRILSQDRPDA